MGRQSGNHEGPVHDRILDIVGASGSANVFASVANTFGYDVLILRSVLYVTTIATAAATLDIGPAADATTANDTQFDGLDVHSATGVFDSANDTDNGTNGVAKPVVWTKDTYVTVKEASGNVDGLVARLHLICAAMPAGGV